LFVCLIVWDARQSRSDRFGATLVVQAFGAQVTKVNRAASAARLMTALALGYLFGAVLLIF
jgi:hypothetical protein